MYPALITSPFEAAGTDALVRAVPPAARRIIALGWDAGRAATALQRLDPQREVIGIEQALARTAEGTCPLEPGSVDCLLYGNVLEGADDPTALLRRHRPWLTPDGVIVCRVRNAQHHGVLTALLCGDAPPPVRPLVVPGQSPGWSYASAFQHLLDAGFLPTLVEDLVLPCPPEVLEALAPLLRHLRLDPQRTRRYLEVAQYIVRGEPTPNGAGAAVPEIGSRGAGPAVPLSFVVCVSDEESLRANLLSSPCLGPGSPHQVIQVRRCASAADGLNRGLAQARHDWVVCLHQDVYLPAGWPERFAEQYRLAEQQLGPVGVAGVYGVSYRDGVMSRGGRVVDRDRLLRESQPLPGPVDTLDELLLALPRGTPLRFDPQLGFHFYGADVCLAARQHGLRAVALDAVCFHNSRSVGLPPAFFPSAALFAAKWRTDLPVATSCVVLERDGTMRPS